MDKVNLLDRLTLKLFETCFFLKKKEVLFYLIRTKLLFIFNFRSGDDRDVSRVGHAEQAHAFPMIFRYLHAPHRPGKYQGVRK